MLIQWKCADLTNQVSSFEFEKVQVTYENNLSKCKSSLVKSGLTSSAKFIETSLNQIPSLVKAGHKSSEQVKNQKQVSETSVDRVKSGPRLCVKSVETSMSQVPNLDKAGFYIPSTNS